MARLFATHKRTANRPVVTGTTVTTILGRKTLAGFVSRTIVSTRIWEGVNIDLIPTVICTLDNKTNSDTKHKNAHKSCY